MRQTLIKTIVILTVAYFSFWLIVTNGQYDALGIGILFVVLAVASYVLLVRMSALENAHHLMTLSKTSFSVVGLVDFMVYFCRYSLVGAVDVARVVTRRNIVDLSPGFIFYTYRLKSNWARMLFAYVVNLLPGTLTLTTKGDQVQVHILQNQEQAYIQLVELEELIAKILKIKLESDQRH